jgi:hypothetical protein
MRYFLQSLPFANDLQLSRWLDYGASTTTMEIIELANR